MPVMDTSVIDECDLEGKSHSYDLASGSLVSMDVSLTSEIYIFFINFSFSNHLCLVSYICLLSPQSFVGFLSEL